jgi:hypothetical protein
MYFRLCFEFERIVSLLIYVLYISKILLLLLIHFMFKIITICV